MARTKKDIASQTQTAAKHAGGRPPKYPTPEGMSLVIQEYFDKCEELKAPATNAGLCVALDLSKQGLNEYSEKPEFSALVKKAKLKIEADVEARLFGSNPTGSIFWLKNHAGYKDKTEQDLNHQGQIIHKVERVVVKP